MQAAKEDHVRVADRRGRSMVFFLCTNANQDSCASIILKTLGLLKRESFFSSKY